MALDGLGDVPLHAVELHGPDHPVVLGADPDKEEPGVVLVSAIVDYLEREGWSVSVRVKLGDSSDLTWQPDRLE